jgi:hypothetical protein
MAGFETTPNSTRFYISFPIQFGENIHKYINNSQKPLGPKYFAMPITA